MKKNSLTWIVFAGISTFLLQACDNQQGRVQYLPDLQDADSVELRYINDLDLPDNDSIVMIRDSSLIFSLVHWINSEEIQHQQCQQEGKLYFFREGEVFKTVYFAVSADSCRYFGFAINGQSYYTRLEDEALDFIRNQDMRSRE